MGIMESGKTINIFCGDLLRFLQIESVLVSQKIPPFSLSFLGIFLFFLLYSHNHGNRAH